MGLTEFFIWYGEVIFHFIIFFFVLNSASENEIPILALLIMIIADTIAALLLLS